VFNVILRPRAEVEIEIGEELYAEGEESLLLCVDEAETLGEEDAEDEKSSKGKIRRLLEGRAGSEFAR
jgi:hypothetical protein